MLLWMTPTIDRTQSDVEYAKQLQNKAWVDFTEEEKQAYLQGLKGSLNVSDLQRIRNNILLLDDVLELGLIVSAVPELPTKEYFSELITNVGLIRNAYMVHSYTPPTPESPMNHYQKWNDLEQILNDVYEILMNNFNYYCGEEIFSGDEIGLLL